MITVSALKLERLMVEAMEAHESRDPEDMEFALRQLIEALPEVVDIVRQSIPVLQAVDTIEQRGGYITAMHYDWGWNVCCASSVPVTSAVSGEGSTLAAALIALATAPSP